jgi:hypothetical protein
MRRRPTLVAALFLAGSLSLVARAEEHGARPEQHGARPERQEAPHFEKHPAGIHPRGATVRPHATRVLRPTVVVRGTQQWHHWAHPEFARPLYYWDWAAVHSVSCVAEDSYGDQYPVSESTWVGFGLASMTDVEDEALDRCYSESGQDASCYLATCSHF